MTRLPVLTIFLMLAGGGAASAQISVPRDVPRRGSIEVSGGGMWAQGFPLESRPATLSRSTPGQPFELFTTASDLRGFEGAYARVGVFVTRAIAVEGGVRWARPTLAVRLSGDAEGADDVVATEQLNHYLLDGAILFHVRRAAFAGGRGLPYLAVGGGQIRELHEGDGLVEIGREVRVSGGVKYWFGSGTRRVGLRGEAGLASREGGADGGGTLRLVPVVLGGLSVLF